jgi:Sec61beta family
MGPNVEKGVDCRDPVVVMVLSLGFIASVFLLQYARRGEGS